MSGLNGLKRPAMTADSITGFKKRFADADAPQTRQRIPSQSAASRTSTSKDEGLRGSKFIGSQSAGKSATTGPVVSSQTDASPTLGFENGVGAKSPSQTRLENNDNIFLTKQKSNLKETAKGVRAKTNKGPQSLLSLAEQLVANDSIGARGTNASASSKFPLVAQNVDNNSMPNVESGYQNGKNTAKGDVDGKPSNDAHIRVKAKVEVNGSGSPIPTSVDKLSELPKDGNNELPVARHRSEFRRLCTSKDHAVVLVVGETGSGKTTKLPQYLLDDLSARKVCVTQPRRVAATSLARRVSHERSQKVGMEVGYRVRFEDFTSSGTRLIFCTDGLLLREAMHDPELRGYDYVVLDEAHERSLNTDILFGVIKRALKLRNRKGRINLRVIVMSATIDVELFQAFFDAIVMNVEGRQHPVEMWYLPQTLDDRIDACSRAALQVHEDEPLPGDILVFLPGKEEIEACCRALEKEKQNLIVCPLHATLPSHVQMRAFERAPLGYRKVVVATNVAETSVTVDGVRFVIDSGMAKVKRREKNSGIKKLALTPISKSQAWQRCGRAGREAPGKCYRLYTEDDFEAMKEDAQPEILRVDLTEVVMQLLALGVDDVTQFDFLQRPDTMALREALSELSTLGAVAMSQQKLVLTAKGRKMSLLPVEPMYANLLLKSLELGCASEVAGIIAMGGGTESPFYGQGDEANAARKKWMHATGDHLTSLAVLEAFEEESKKGHGKQFTQQNFVRPEIVTQAVQAKRQLLDICAKFEVQDKVLESTVDSKGVLRCLATGLSSRLAKKVGKSEYEPLFAKGTLRAFIHPSSVLTLLTLRPDYIVFDELLVTSKTYLRGVSAVENASWLTEDQPSLFRSVPKTPSAKDAEKLNQERKAVKLSRASAID